MPTDTGHAAAQPAGAAGDRALIERVARRYRTLAHRSYARGKLRWDPLFTTAAALLSASPRPLLDVGCGLGLLGQYLRECGFLAPYLGLDLDAKKIEAARDAASRGPADLAFTPGAANALPPHRGDVAMFDVLHYLARDAQQRALVDAASRVAADGLLVIRSVLREPGWRFRATQAEERLARALGWMRCPTGHFPLRADLADPLREKGFRVDVSPLWGRTPFNSYLFVARRESI
jgi:2-polyprenyl-3-methyl-5-hydroxy-6-metoxy-1,4-benzoquinol methylase